MSRLQELIDSAYTGKSGMDRAYGPFPVSIAAECGAPEVREIIERLDQLAIERKKVAEWDGDTRDDIWRLQKGLGELLSALVSTFPQEASESLKSSEYSTRFWGAHAMKDNPSPDVLDALTEAHSKEQMEHVKKMLGEAMVACSRKRGWFSWLFRT